MGATAVGVVAAKVGVVPTRVGVGGTVVGVAALQPATITLRATNNVTNIISLLFIIALPNSLLSWDVKFARLVHVTAGIQHGIKL